MRLSVVKLSDCRALGFRSYGFSVPGSLTPVSRNVEPHSFQFQRDSSRKILTIKRTKSPET